MTSFNYAGYSTQLSLGRSISMIRGLVIFIVMLLITTCANSPKLLIIEVDNGSSSEAKVGLTLIPETKDLFGQIGKAYSIDAGDQFTFIQIPFEVTYELGKFDPVSLYIAKYSSKYKKFAALSSQVDLKTGVVKAKYTGSGIYTLFARVIGGVGDYHIEEACELIQEFRGLELEKIDDICPRILCANDFNNRLVEPSISPGSIGGSIPPIGGNLCDRCLDSFNTKLPTICAPKDCTSPPLAIDELTQQDDFNPTSCMPETDPLAPAKLTQRGMFDPTGETCFISGKTTLLRASAKSITTGSSTESLSDVLLTIFNNGGGKVGTVSGFTFDVDNITKLESIPPTKDVFFIVPGEMLNKQGSYHFRINGKQGSRPFANTITTQWFKRSGDITMIVVPIEDAFDSATEMPHVLRFIDDIARSFPLRDGSHAAIIPSWFSSAKGVMFSIAAPISQTDFKLDWVGELKVLIDDYNDANIYDARVISAILSGASSAFLTDPNNPGKNFIQGGQRTGRATWSRINFAGVSLTHEIGHTQGLVKPSSPNSNTGRHSRRRGLGVEGYNLSKQQRIPATDTKTIMTANNFRNRDHGFFELYEWNQLCERMTSRDYVRFQDPTFRILANALNEEWPASFSMIGNFDDNGEINIIRSYRTKQPRAEIIAYESDYYVVFSDSQGLELNRKPLAISEADDYQKDGNIVRSETKPHSLVGAAFSFVSAIPTKTTRVSIVKDGKVLASVNKSEYAPLINMFNVEKAKSDELIFSWEIEDKDGNTEISSSILVSRDGGESFQPVTSNRKDNIFKWRPHFLKDEVQLIFELKVTDGFHVTKSRYKQKAL